MSTLNLNMTNGFGKAVGSLGSGAAIALGLVCPVCIPAVGAFLTSIGLTVLVSATVLKPLLVFFLGVAAIGFILGYRKHHNPWPALGAVAGAAALYAGRWMLFSTPLIYAGAGAFLVSSVANTILRRRTTSCCSGACDITPQDGVAFEPNGGSQ